MVQIEIMIKKLFLLFAFCLSLNLAALAQPKAPYWVVNLYMTDSSKLAPTQGMPNMFAPKAVELVFFRQLNDSASYCIYKADNGICVLYYLATQKNRKHFAEEQIGNECVPENSSISFTSSSFRLDSVTNTITVLQQTETASDQFIINDGQFKRFKPGFSRTNSVMERTEKLKKLRVLEDSVIEESKISR